MGDLIWLANKTATFYSSNALKCDVDPVFASVPSPPTPRITMQQCFRHYFLCLTFPHSSFRNFLPFFHCGSLSFLHRGGAAWDAEASSGVGGRPEPCGGRAACSHGRGSLQAGPPTTAPKAG